MSLSLSTEQGAVFHTYFDNQQSTINTVFSQDEEMAGLVLRVQSSQVFELLGAKHSQNTSIPCTRERKGY